MGEQDQKLSNDEVIVWTIPESVWSQSVGDIRCLNRTVNALLRNRYFTLGQLDGLSPGRLVKLRNVGEHGISELSKEILKICEMGLSYFPEKQAEHGAGDGSLHESTQDFTKARRALESQRYLAKWFPTLPKNISVPDKWLEVRTDSCHFDNRTTNALERNGLQFLRDLNGMPTYRLLQLRGIGNHGVMELTSKLEDLFAEGDPDPRLTHMAETPVNVEDALNMMRRNSPSFDDRVVLVMTARFGLLGHPRMTLQQIGEHFRVSRERVRQIEKVGLRRLKKSRGSFDWTTISASREWKALLAAIDKAEL